MINGVTGSAYSVVVVVVYSAPAAPGLALRSAANDAHPGDGERVQSRGQPRHQ